MIKRCLLTLATALSFCLPAHAEWFQEDQIGTLPVVVLKTKGESLGTVILAHGCSGPTATRDRGWASRLQDAGFATVQFDSWAHRNIPGGVCKTDAVTGDERVAEVKLIIEWLKTQPWHAGKVHILGFSHGGTTALSASTQNLGIGKAVAIYPWCDPRFSNAKIPTQIHIGEADDWTPASRCKYMYGFFSPNKNGEIFTYPGVYHDYDRFIEMDKWYEGRGERAEIVKRRLKTDAPARELTISRVITFLKG